MRLDLGVLMLMLSQCFNMVRSEDELSLPRLIRVSSNYISLYGEKTSITNNHIRVNDAFLLSVMSAWLAP